MYYHIVMSDRILQHYQDLTSKEPERTNVLARLPKPPLLIRQKNYYSLNLMDRIKLAPFNDPVYSDDISFGLLCINCYEMIPNSLIMHHSLNCNPITEGISDNCLEKFECIKHKIDRLRLFLDVNIYTDFSQSDKHKVLLLKELCAKALKSNFVYQKPLLLSISQNVKNMLCNFDGPISLRLYVERLNSLFDEIKETYESIEIEEKRKEIEELKQKVEIFKNRAEVLQKTFFKSNPALIISFTKLDDIDSDVEVPPRSGSSIGSVISARESIDSNLKSPKNTKDGLQKYFYSKCLAAKLNNSERVENVPVSSLYLKVLEMKLPIENWPEFIESELQHPENWANTRVSRRTSNSVKSFSNKNFTFETIQEEDI